MLMNRAALDAQLRGADRVDAPIKAVYLHLVTADVGPNVAIRPTGHGYIERELRFEAEAGWLASAVLNQKWVLWYYRRPAINAGLIDLHQTLERFPESSLTAKQEIKLRVSSLGLATDLVAWLTHRMT